MSDEPPPRLRGDSLPPLMWGLLGAILVGLFVLVIGLLNPVS